MNLVTNPPCRAATPQKPAGSVSYRLTVTNTSELGDAYGVPNNVLRLSDEFYGGLGRIAALGAIVELRMSDIVVLWGREDADTGQQMRFLVDRFREIKKARIDAGQDVPELLVRAVDDAHVAMKQRNELIHSLWPGEDIGWRNRPGGSVPTVHLGVPALRDVIGHLLRASEGLGRYLYSPTEPTPIATMRRRRDVPTRHAVRAHDEGSNGGGSPLPEEYRIDAWSRALVKVRDLRTAHNDFHGTKWPLGKEHLLHDCLKSVRSAIEAGTWPCTDQITTRPSGNFPPIHAERCSNGQIYVIDGQLRVLTALWNGIVELDAYVVEMPDRHRPSP